MRIIEQTCPTLVTIGLPVSILGALPCTLSLFLSSFFLSTIVLLIFQLEFHCCYETVAVHWPYGNRVHLIWINHVSACLQEAPSIRTYTLNVVKWLLLEKAVAS